MENIGLSLVIGILSSLFATALFISISELIRRVFIPWYSDKIYRGVRIDGIWDFVEANGVSMSSPESPALMSLTQKGEIITGSYSHKDDITNEIDEYILEGKVRDMYFLATAIPKSKRQIDALSLLLHVNNVKSQLIMSGSILSTGDPGCVESHDGVKFVWKNS